ncbi:sensor histidine kinase [Rufibacter glacialis]|uniref:Sensor histidine kinase n=1 Tax=Rufibacter glacialis TaxID=1259555 RepID=A0A5M8Q4Y2_9BACT|nr:histidine kinase [Rufibacter glacialis]KAA6430191.1 sensor histidine kinase [Rufibacter glacialis]GGK87169.1 sensor histidine kinase [Rufibacter glacialis]
MSSLKVILLYLGWALLWAVVQTLVIQEAGYPVGLAWKDASLSSGLVVGSGYVMSLALRFYRPGGLQVVYLMGWSLGVAMISLVLWETGMEYLLSPQEAYLAFVEQTFFVRLAFAWLMILFIVLQNWLCFYALEKQEAEERKTATEKLAREAELFNLRQQLQPHFLFNSLNSISALVKTQPDQAKKMVQQLSDFLRGTLRKDDQTMVPLADELQHLQIYLEIEKVRFGHRLQTQVDYQEESLPLQLPYLLLQPIVENAIKFGLYDTIDDILIQITATRQDSLLVISTQNPFDSALLQHKQGTGFGLESVRRRLYLLYARTDLLSTHQQDNVFITTVKIPQKP